MNVSRIIHNNLRVTCLTTNQPVVGSNPSGRAKNRRAPSRGPSVFEALGGLKRNSVRGEEGEAPLLRDHVFANPGKYLLKRAVVGFEHSDNELLAFVDSKNEFPPVQTQEYVGGEECDSLIAIDEGVIDQQGLEHRCCHFFNMCVVTGLRPKEGTFQESLVANAVVATKSLDQSLLNCEHFIKR